MKRRNESKSTSSPETERESSPPEGSPNDGDRGSSGVQERLAGAARDAMSSAKQQAESMYRDASSVAGETSDAIDDAANALESSGHETLSEAAAALSQRVQAFADYLEDRKLEDLVGDARSLAQRNPGLFIAGGVTLGFALSRFLKASAADASRSADIS